MHARILDLDGSVASQERLAHRLQPEVIDLRRWGPKLRLGCTWRRFRAFEQALVLPHLASAAAPHVFFLGARHFHHVTLAILRRIDGPFNLLVLDAATDCRRGWPVLSHASWLGHATALTQVRRIFHVGATRGLADRVGGGPAREAAVVVPFGAYCGTDVQPLRTNLYRRCDLTRLQQQLAPHAEELRRWPLYVSLDKNVLVARNAIVNGGAGHMWQRELEEIVAVFDRLAGGVLAMDVVGDWSPVRTSGLVGGMLARTAQAAEWVRDAQAHAINERANLQLMMRWFGKEFAAPAVAMAA